MGVNQRLPHKFTPEVRGAIIESLRKGNFMQTAFARAGIAQNTYYRWLKKGEIGPGEPGYDPDFHQFYLDCKQAEAEAEERMAGKWSEAANEDWKAAQAFLVHRHPDRWGLKTKTEVSGPGGLPLTFTIELNDATSGEGRVDFKGGASWEEGAQLAPPDAGHQP